MAEVNLLAKLLRDERNVCARATASKPDVVCRPRLGTAFDLPFPTAASKPRSLSTPSTISVATVCIQALEELRRVSNGRAFVQVDSYRTPEQEEILSARMKQATEQAACPSSFDLELPRARCKRCRRRILDMSQNVAALHIGGAFSCTEIVDCIYNELMRPGNPGGKSPDTFLMSKGHGCMIQYVVLEDLGVLSPADLDAYCTLAAHGLTAERILAAVA
jgi:hypothetical protein